MKPNVIIEEELQELEFSDMKSHSSLSRDSENEETSP